MLRCCDCQTVWLQPQGNLTNRPGRFQVVLAHSRMIWSSTVVLHRETTRSQAYRYLWHVAPVLPLPVLQPARSHLTAAKLAARVETFSIVHTPTVDQTQIPCTTWEAVVPGTVAKNTSVLKATTHRCTTHLRLASTVVLAQARHWRGVKPNNNRRTHRVAKVSRTTTSARTAHSRRPCFLPIWSRIVVTLRCRIRSSNRWISL